MKRRAPKSRRHRPATTHRRRTVHSSLAGSAARIRTLSVRERETRNRALHALALMRDGESLAAACRAEHIKPNTLLRYVGSAVRRDKPGGRFCVAAQDTLTRDLQVQTADGTVRVAAKGIKAARRFSAHANAIAHFNRTGDTSKLKPFKGKTFTAEGRRYEFLTDPDRLMELAEADALRLDSLYASVATRRP